MIENKIVFESENLYVFQISNSAFEVRANTQFASVSLGVAKSKEQAIRCAKRLEKYPKKLKEYIK